jgi:hypothetical protein
MAAAVAASGRVCGNPAHSQLTANSTANSTDRLDRTAHRRQTGPADRVEIDETLLYSDPDATSGLEKWY